MCIREVKIPSLEVLDLIVMERIIPIIMKVLLVVTLLEAKQAVITLQEVRRNTEDGKEQLLAVETLKVEELGSHSHGNLITQKRIV